MHPISNWTKRRKSPLWINGSHSPNEPQIDSVSTGRQNKRSFLDSFLLSPVYLHCKIEKKRLGARACLGEITIPYSSSDLHEPFSWHGPLSKTIWSRPTTKVEESLLIFPLFSAWKPLPPKGYRPWLMCCRAIFPFSSSPNLAVKIYECPVWKDGKRGPAF